MVLRDEILVSRRYRRASLIFLVLICVISDTNLRIKSDGDSGQYDPQVGWIG